MSDMVGRGQGVKNRQKSSDVIYGHSPSLYSYYVSSDKKQCVSSYFNEDINLNSKFHAALEF